MFTAGKGYSPQIVYRNIRRPEVDAIFTKKNNLLEDVQFLKTKIYKSNNKHEIESFQNKIKSLIPEINAFDTKARNLWSEIKQKSKSLPNFI